MKTGVLVHGCNLHIENWRHVAWGDPPHELGRIPQGILVALERQADLIIFGTGASKKAYRWGDDDEPPLLAEAEYSREYLADNFEKLAKFSILGKMKAFSSKSAIQQTKDRILNRIVLDLESQNTVEEIYNAGIRFVENEIDACILVSSSSHVVRCLRDAANLFHDDDQFQRFRDRIYAIPSRTCYEGTTAGDVVVVEPPHRPDRHVVPTHRRIQRMMTLQRLQNDDLVNLIVEFDDLLQKYEHKFFNN